MSGIFWTIVLGFVIGVLARFFHPGKDSMGFIVTILLGIAGSFVGGTIVNLIQGGGLFEGRTVGWIGSILGAVLLLFLAGLMSKKTQV